MKSAHSRGGTARNKLQTKADANPIRRRGKEPFLSRPPAHNQLMLDGAVGGVKRNREQPVALQWALTASGSGTGQRRFDLGTLVEDIAAWSRRAHFARPDPPAGSTGPWAFKHCIEKIIVALEVRGRDAAAGRLQDLFEQLGRTVEFYHCLNASGGHRSLTIREQERRTRDLAEFIVDAIRAVQWDQEVCRVLTTLECGRRQESHPLNLTERQQNILIAHQEAELKGMAPPSYRKLASVMPVCHETVHRDCLQIEKITGAPLPGRDKDRARIESPIPPGALAQRADRGW